MTNLLLFAAVLTIVLAAFLSRGRKVTVIYPSAIGLLYRDGRFQRELPPGRYSRFDPFDRTRVVKVSLVEEPAEFREINVLSKDQFSFRIGLAPVLRVVDARLYAETHAPALLENERASFVILPNGPAALHLLLAAAATEMVASRTLPEIFADQLAVAEDVRAKLEQAIPGALIQRVLLTSLMLPPETRKMFTDVERARMEGQAALERARAEHAALRVLANAARLVADNPALANLRLLQAVESSKGATTIVIGNSGGLAGVPVQGEQPSQG